ncbi:MAG: metallophosphoesterase family protein [Lentisphaeria bacterium]
MLNRWVTTSESNAPFRPFRFAIITDLHVRQFNGRQKLAEAIDRLNAVERLEFVLVLGDLIPDGTPAAFAELMAPLRVPYHLIYGNNDRAYMDRWGDALEPLYYAFTWCDCLFVGFWNCLERPGFGDHMGIFDERQMEWAEELLQQHSDGRIHTFLYAHCPIREPGNEFDKFWIIPDQAERWVGWCERFDVTACFFGHVHHHEDFSLNGTRFFSTESLNWNFDPVPAGTPYFEGEWGQWGAIQIVDVTAGGIELTREAFDWPPLES